VNSVSVPTGSLKDKEVRKTALGEVTCLIRLFGRLDVQRKINIKNNILII
jgi:hypothetical protein